MSPSPIVVRPLATDAESDAFFTMSDQAFSAEPSAESARYWQEFVLSEPTSRPELIRGAFRDDAQLGGYSLFERLMHVGAAHLLTGCIGSVVTQPEQRKQGVARALMHDCIDFARAHHYALLLLDGIPDFYYRFGYTNVFDVTRHEINRAAILAQPSSAYTIRPATPADAATVVALYDRVYGGGHDTLDTWYSGSFVRSIERQQHVLQRRDAANPLLLAVDASGQALGYVSLGSSANAAESGEIVAADWPALLALLQHHAQRTEEPALRHRLPPDSAMLNWLVAHLEMPDKPSGPHVQPSELWSVRSQSFHHRHAGWMARVVDVAALAQAMFPAWQSRWQAALASWNGDITFVIDDAHFVLHCAGEQLQLRPDAAPTGEIARLTPQALTQLVFGYRPIAWLATQPDQDIPASTHALLNVLFPAGHAWIPRSDWF